MAPNMHHSLFLYFLQAHPDLRLHVIYVGNFYLVVLVVGEISAHVVFKLYVPTAPERISHLSAIGQ